MIPDNVEKIIMTKEDYDRNVEQLLLEKINAEQEIERLRSIIKEANGLLEEYRYTNVEEYGKIIEFFKKLKTILGKENK